MSKKLYNMLPDRIKFLNVKSCKNRIRNMLIGICVYYVKYFIEYLKSWKR